MMATAAARPVAALAVLLAQLSGKPPGFAPGEVVVRFTQSSDGRPTTTDAAKDPRLAPFLERVSREIRRPLRLVRVGSGGDLLLELDPAGLASRLEADLLARPGVTQVEALSATEDERRSTPRAAVKARVGRATHDLASKVSQDLDLPVRERRLANGERLFQVDLETLTLDVVERLKKRSDVDYAQPNYTASIR
jgi:hypothetical protein